MFAVGFDATTETEHLGIGHTVAGDAREDVGTARERAGLVEQHRVDGIRSSANRSLIGIPALADIAVEMAMTSGIARPRACGQAMISTVTVRTTASSRSPMPHHTRNAARPAAAAT